jgi:hypothetical protein
MPLVRGRELPTGRWELQTTIHGRAVAPYSEDIIYTGVYPSWGFGVEIAMQDALARIYGVYCKDLPTMLVFRGYGKRNQDGVPLESTINRTELARVFLQLQDLEFHIAIMGNKMTMEMQERDHATIVIDQLQGEIQTLHTATEILEDTVTDLEAQVADRDAQIAALQAQINPPPLDNDNGNDGNDDGDNDDDGDDDVDDDNDDEGGANATQGEGGVNVA